MPLRDVTIRLGLNAAPFVAGAKAAQASATKLGADVTRSMAGGSKAAGILGSSFGVVGIAAGLAGAKMISAAADFDQGMSNVKATGADAAKNIGALRQAALDAGAATKYSATEAAGGVEALAKAGIASADILGGGLKGSLSLAAAGNLDVAGSAEAAASAMNQFALSGKDVPHIADLLAAGAGKAQGEVSDMAMALNQAGLIAHGAGASIEETTGTLAAFASAGLVGSDAGTSFKTMLQRLQAPSSQAAGLMKQLGISAYDSEGNFVGLAKVAGQLNDAFKDQTPKARAAALAIIFGTDAVRAANVLYSQGEGGIRKWTDTVNDSGYAADVAKTKMDNLKGDIENLKGSIDTVFIQGGESGQGPLRTFVQGLTDLTNAIGKVNTAIDLSRFKLSNTGNPFGVFGDIFQQQRIIGQKVNIERKVVTKFQTIGADGSVRDAVRVAAAAHLTPKVVRTVLDLLGWSTKKIDDVIAGMNKADKRNVISTLKLSGIDLTQKQLDKFNLGMDEAAAKHPKPRVDIQNLTPSQQKLAEFYGLQKKVDSTNPTSKVTVDTSDATSKINKLQSLLDNFVNHGKEVGFGTVLKASGGAIIGPGTATSDSIPARLSDGEHVLTASDVNKLGGQSNVYSLRRAIQAGAFQFAGGGASYAQPVRSYAAGGAVSSSSRPTEYYLKSGALTLDGGKAYVEGIIEEQAFAYGVSG